MIFSRPDYGWDLKPFHSLTQCIESVQWLIHIILFDIQTPQRAMLGTCALKTFDHSDELRRHGLTNQKAFTKIWLVNSSENIDISDNWKHQLITVRVTIESDTGQPSQFLRGFNSSTPLVDPFMFEAQNHWHSVHIYGVAPPFWDDSWSSASFRTLSERGWE